MSCGESQGRGGLGMLAWGQEIALLGEAIKVKGLLADVVPEKNLMGGGTSPCEHSV